MPTQSFGPFTVVGSPVNTGIDVSTGDRITVYASGLIDFGGAFAGIGAPIVGPDGDDGDPAPYPAPNFRRHSLICDVGGTFFRGGTSRSFVSTVSGRLRLCPNDHTPDDNSRGWRITVLHSFPDPPPAGSPPGTPAGSVPTPVVGRWLFYTLDGVGGIFGPDCGFSPSPGLFNNRLHVFYGENTWAGSFYNIRHMDFSPVPVSEGMVGVFDLGAGPHPPERNIEVIATYGGPVSAAVVHDGRINVFYGSKQANWPNELVHATFSDREGRQSRVLDGTAGSLTLGERGPSLNGEVWGDVVYGNRVRYSRITALSAGGALHVFYFGVTNLDAGPGDDARGVPTGLLRHARFAPPLGWRFEDLDGAAGGSGQIAPGGGAVGQFSSAVVDQNGRIHLFYSEADLPLGLPSGPSVTNLRYAWSDDGVSWQFQTIDGRGGGDGRIRARVGTFPNAIEFAGKVHVFYRDDTNKNVRHGVLDGNRWSFERLDGGGEAPGETDHNVWPVAVARLDDRLSVFEYDRDRGYLRHAYWMGVNWQFETLDGAFSDSFGRISADVGSSAAAIGISPNRYAVFYRDDTNTDLRYADFRPPGG